MSTSLIKKMKERIAKSGSSKKEILYFGKDTVKRIRFIQELDDGYQFQFHNDYNAGIYTLCQDPEDHEDCELCKEEIGIQDTFVWSVWSYDDNAVRIIAFKASGVSPVPSFIEMYEEFGTIMDRDYKVKKVGQGMGGSFVVTPLDKERFKNKKAKPFTEKQVRELFEKAYPLKKDDEDDEDEDDEDEIDEKKSSGSKKKKGSKNKKRKEKTVREKYEELEWDELKEIAIEIGVSKKQIKKFDEDEDEIIEYLFDEYEEDDLEEMLEDMEEDDDEEDDEDDE